MKYKHWYSKLIAQIKKSQNVGWININCVIILRVEHKIWSKCLINKHKHEEKPNVY